MNSCIESFNNNNENEIYLDRCKKNDDNNNKVTNAKRFYIIPPKNRYLLILLKRFAYTNNGEKIINDVTPNKTIIIADVKYTLSGVIVHDGEKFAGGHYVFIQCNKDGVFATIYNDSNVYMFNENEKYNTEFINNNGYIFTYTRYPVDQP